MKDPLLDHPLICQRYFFPRSEPLPGAVMVRSGDVELACFSVAPHPGAKTLVHFHGNGEIVGDYVDLIAKAFTTIGLNVFFAEFRGYGGSTGTPMLAAMLDDVEPIIRATNEDPQNLILFGRSLGSVYAVHGVDRVPGIGGLILESGLADSLERLLLRVRPEELGCTHDQLAQAVHTHLNHETKLHGYHGPTLVMHTRNDGLVDLSHAQRLHQWVGGVKELLIFEEGNHNSILPVNFPRYMGAIKGFADSL